MTQRREITAALVLCVLGAALLLLAAGRDWVRIPATGSLFANSVAKADVADLVRALGLAALTGVVGIAAARGRGRAAVGVVLALVGGYAAAVAAGAGVSPESQMLAGAAAEPAVEFVATAWPWVAAAGGLLVCLAGLLVAARGPRWSALSQRYAGAAAAPAPAATEAGLWDALSRGDDPTV